MDKRLKALEDANRHNYMLLSRISQDCIAFFGATGNEAEDSFDCRYYNEHFVWGNSIDDAMKKVFDIWEAIPNEVKPEWFTQKDLDNLNSKYLNFIENGRK